MRQQINLYQAVLIDKPEPLQARQAGLLLLVFLALLVALTLFKYWQVDARQQTLVKLQQQESELTAQVNRLEQQYPQRQKDAALEKELRETEQRVAGERQLLKYFSARGKIGNEVILGTLEGLAKHVQQGIWLKRIQLENGGQQVRLAGSALRPEQVPAYLQYLGQQGVFTGQVFSSFKLSRLEEHPGEVDFSLESTPENAQ